MPDNQTSLNTIRDKVFRQRVAEILGEAADDATVDALLDVAEKYTTSVVQEREHYRGVIDRMTQGHRRLDAAMKLAVEYTWTTADGRTVTITPSDLDVFIRVDGTVYGWADSVGTAIHTAARIAPPADTALAELLTWTACGRPRT